MKKSLLSLGLVVPFLAGAAFAQEAVTEEPPTEDTATEGVVVEEAPAEEAETEVIIIEEAPAEEAEADAAVVEEAPAEEAPAPDVIVREQAPDELRVDWITGTTVRSPEDEAIGGIQDLIVDAETGEMTAAILSVGGFLGIGAKQIAVDWNELQIDYDANEIRLDLTRQEAEEAPDYQFRDQEPPPPPADMVPAGDPMAPEAGPVDPMAPGGPVDPMAPGSDQPNPMAPEVEVEEAPQTEQ